MIVIANEVFIKEFHLTNRKGSFEITKIVYSFLVFLNDFYRLTFCKLINFVMFI